MIEPGAPASSAAAPHPYGEAYFRHYHSAEGPVPYDRSHAPWLIFFGQIADAIARDFAPRRVLDVGCAKGFLVESLRDRGVAAYGFDISAYAIGEVRPDVRRHCWVASAAEHVPGPFDLVTCIEVLEHLPEDEARRAVANLAAAAEDLLFSSSPDALDEPTHVTVRPREWWIARFAECGMALEPACDTRFIAPHAMRFRRSGAPVSAVDALLDHRYAVWDRLADRTAAAGALERVRARLESDLAATRRAGEALRNELFAIRPLAQRLERTLEESAALRGAIGDKDVHIGNLDTTIHHLRAEQERTLEESDALRGAVGDKDVHIRNLDATIHHLRAEKDAHIWSLDATIHHLRAENDQLHEVVDEKDKVIASANYRLISIQRTLGWKVLEAMRRLRDVLLPADSRRRSLYWRLRRPAEVLIDEGFSALTWKTLHKIRLRYQGYESLVKPPAPSTPTEDDAYRYDLWLLRDQSASGSPARSPAPAPQLAYTPVISVVMPVYNTDERWLRCAIESVRAQTYQHWELCIANDGSDAGHVRSVLDEYVATDARIWVKHLPRNTGIAGASNHALQLATGEFVALLDHDDELAPQALVEVARTLNARPDLDLVYSDEDKLDADGRRVEPFFKPDWSPDLLTSMNYITHLAVFRRAVLAELEGFRGGFEGSQDYDLMLRFTERTARIAHIPKILYHWRKVQGSAATSTAAKPYAYEAARRALEDALRRRGRPASVATYLPGLYTVRYEVSGDPLVSIVIPTRDRWSLLQQCVRSIEERTKYSNYEIVILDNDSAEPETRRGLSALSRKYRVLHVPGAFNFSALNNLGAREAKGDYLLFLNNDTQVIEADWLSAMLEHAQRPEVGAVGARLHYPDGRIQHAGLVLGIGGIADHAFKGLAGDAFHYFLLGHVVRNVSAVTAACMMVGRRVFDEVQGFDEDLAVALNDVDLCLRLRQRGYLVVYTPHALLYHHESSTRGRLHPPSDEERMWRLWGKVIRKGDPYYNPNLTLSRTDWSLAERPIEPL